MYTVKQKTEEFYLRDKDEIKAAILSKHKKPSCDKWKNLASDISDSSDFRA